MPESINILMVEKEIAECELIGRQLRRAGMTCEITRVDTESGFRRALRDNPPQLITSDALLPHFSGLGALAIATELAPSIPFIFVSGTIGEERAIDALRRGATDYVLKSNLGRLPAVIDRAIKEARTHATQQSMEKTLQDIVSSSQDWIWQVDAAGHFTFSSLAVTSILGYRPEELLGQHYSMLIPAGERAQASERLPATDPIGTILNSAIAAWQHKDGAIHWLERNAKSVRGERGELLGFRGSDRDVTLRREQDARIRRLDRVHLMLSRINSAIIRISDRSALLSELCRIAHEQGGYDMAIIRLVDPGTQDLSPAAWSGEVPEAILHARFSLDQRADAPRITAEVIRSGVPAVINNLANNVTKPMYGKELQAIGINSLIILPLMVDGTGIGTLVLYSRTADVFDATELDALRELVGNIGYALQYIEKGHAVEFLSYFDPATGLAKRALFCERLARALTSSVHKDEVTSVAVFDVQRLSLVNDTYGRHAGDQLLASIGNRMKQLSPDPELLAHFGGGTFAGVFHHRGDSESTARHIHNEASRFFTEAFHIEGHEIRPSIRSGVAWYPSDGLSADLLVQNAEAALKYARESGERHAVFGLVERHIGDDRVRFESRLAGAFARREFILHYQPKIDLVSGRISGVEALLRWQDPEAGLIAPMRFVPLLEQTGMIVEVGQWIFEQAARDCQLWMRSGLPPIRVAVNVSPIQLRREDFAARAIATAHGWATDAAGLDVEITESILTQDHERSIRKLQQLRSAGMRVAIDDFGTGHSSLRRLAALPIDTLKIDRAFIIDIAESQQDLAIVRTIVSLAQAFNLSTVAEGVETEQQLQLLRELECSHAQGYIYSAPVPADVLPETIRNLSVSRYSPAFRASIGS